MNPIIQHILETSGMDAPHAEPRGNSGDRLVFVFCLGLALGWLVGAA